MSRFHSADEIRRYDLMKLGVLLLLLVLLGLTWYTTRDLLLAEGDEEVENVAQATPPATTAVAGGATPSTAAAPVVNAPTGAQPSGNVTLTGSAEPGTQINILVNGQPAGAATAGVDGSWSVTMELPAGNYSVEAQTVDNVGVVIDSSEPVQVIVADDAVPATEAGPSIAPTPVFDPAAGTYTYSGVAVPGENIVLTAGGVAVGSATADQNGNWSIVLPSDAVSGDVQVQASGATVTIEEVATPAAPTPTEAAPAAGTQTVGQLLAGMPEFSSFMTAIEISGLRDTLDETRNYTVFAPTNDVFAALPQQVVDTLLANPPILSEILQYHVTFGRYLAADLVVVAPSTLNGLLLTISTQGDSLLVNNANVTATDLVADNGVVHAIDRLLLPPLAEGIRPPVIDTSGVATFTGTFLTIIGTAEPGRTILVELNGEPFGQPATVSPETTWSAAGNVTPGEYVILAYMLGADGVLEAISSPITLQVQ
jgi:uncharacterized surface protein with fasciclin (FAS1) repeats